MRQIIGLAILLVSAFAFPREVTLHFPKEGRFVLFLQGGEENVYQVEGKDIVVDLPEGELKLAVCDEQNRGASKSLGAKESSLSFSESDFNLIYKVVVNLTDSKGTPIDYAVVNLKDSSGNRHTEVVREENKGICYFYFLPQGKASLEARRGDLRASQDLELVQKTEVVPYTISFASLTLTPKEEKAEGKPAEKAEEKPAPKGGVSPFLSAFLSLLIILIILYGIYLFLKRRGLDLIAMMRQTREQVPAGPTAPPSPIPTSPDICPYCGQKKDPITGACACTPTTSPAPSVPQASTGQARLVGLEGAVLGSVFPIGKETTIGRGEDRDIVVRDNAVSRKHCRIVLEEDGYYIVDEGSTNGTFVGGVRITRAKLQNGDIIQIGESKMRFEM